MISMGHLPVSEQKHRRNRWGGGDTGGAGKRRGKENFSRDVKKKKFKEKRESFLCNLS